MSHMNRTECVCTGSATQHQAGGSERVRQLDERLQAVSDLLPFTCDDEITGQTDRRTDRQTD